MDWKHKMSLLVDIVLNDRFDRPVYKLIIQDEHNYKITEDDVEILSTEILQDLRSHWKTYAVDVIKRVIDIKIQRTISCATTWK